MKELPLLKHASWLNLKRSVSSCILLVCLALPQLAQSAQHSGTIDLLPGSSFFSDTDIRVTVPDDGRTLKGAILTWPGSSGGLRFADVVAPLAEVLDFAIIEIDRSPFVFQPVDLIDRLMAEAAALAGDPALATLPALTYGFSAGSIQSGNLGLFEGDRLYAYGGLNARHGFSPTLDGTFGAPGLMVTGSVDFFNLTYTPPDVVQAPVEDLAALDERVAFGLNWFAGHSASEVQGNEAILYFFQEVARARQAIALAQDGTDLPLGPDGNVLMPVIPIEDGWLAEHPDFIPDPRNPITQRFVPIVPYADFTGVREDASWMPNYATALLYQSMVSFYREYKLINAGFRNSPLAILDLPPFHPVETSQTIGFTVAQRDFPLDGGDATLTAYLDGVPVQVLNEPNVGGNWRFSFPVGADEGLASIVVIGESSVGEQSSLFRTITVYDPGVASEAGPNGFLPEDGSVLGAGNQTLTWVPGFGVDTFDVYLAADDPSLLTPVAQDISAPQWTATNLSAGQRYFWRVDAHTSAGVVRGSLNTFIVPVAFDGFESQPAAGAGWGEPDWTGTDFEISDVNAETGAFSLDVKGAGVAERSVDASAASFPVLYFSWYAENMRDTDSYVLEVDDGAGWQTVMTVYSNAALGERYDDETWHREGIVLDGFARSSNLKFRFRSNPSGGNTESLYVDNIWFAPDVPTNPIEDGFEWASLMGGTGMSGEGWLYEIDRSWLAPEAVFGNAYAGDYSVILQSNTTFSRGFLVGEVSNPIIQFARKVDSYEPGDSAAIEVLIRSDESATATWQGILMLDDAASDNTWHSEQFELVGLVSGFRIVTSTGTNDRFHFDALSVTSRDAPSVDVGADQLLDIANGSTIPLNGIVVSGSGGVTTLWQVDAEPPGGNARFSDASSPVTTVTFDTAGVYTLTLTADDGENPAGTDSLTLTVYSANSDVDSNGLGDAWELFWFGSLGQDATADSDNDGADLASEEANDTDPTLNDTDADGVLDGVEIGSSIGRDPSGADLLTVDFFDGFESFSGALLSNDSWWNGSVDGTYTIDETVSVTGSKSLRIDGSEAYLLFERPLNQVVFFDQYLLLDPYSEANEDPVVDSSTSAAFYLVAGVGENEYFLRVLDGGTWVTMDSLGPVDASQFQRVTVRSDYHLQTWSIWLNGTLAGEDLAFANSVSHLNRYALAQSENSSGWLDDLSIQIARPADLTGGSWSGYSVWQGQEVSWGAVLAQLRTEDADLDGLSNFAEYALDLDPLAPDLLGRPTLETVSGAHGTELVFTYRQPENREVVDYRVQLSFDMLSWDDVVGLVPEDAGSDVDGTPLVRIRIQPPADAASVFLRLQMDEN